MTDEVKPILSNTAYTRIKILNSIWLPAIASLYFGLANIWDLPAAEEVIGTIALITVFLGALLKFAASRYEKSDAAFDGQMVVNVDPDSGKKTVSLELKKDPNDLINSETVAFKVTDHPSGDAYEEVD